MEASILLLNWHFRSLYLDLRSCIARVYCTNILPSYSRELSINVPCSVCKTESRPSCFQQ